MNRLIRWYNKNREFFWLTIVIAIIVINIPRALNEYVKSKKNQENIVKNNTIIYDDDNYSVINRGTINEEKAQENTDIINTFIEYCNNKEPEKAYKILSDKCKEKLYPSLEDFINKYYNRIFRNEKIYNVQLWIKNANSYTYKIELKEDMLNTGNANPSTIEDYYTIIKENNIDKLNINNYIKSVNINKNKEIEEVKITVLSKDIFMEHEIYNLSIENKTRNSILLDGLEKVDSMYLEDSEKLGYNAYNHEIATETLRVKAKKNIGIKFNKKYSNQRKLKKIIFSDIILDYDEYFKSSNKKDYENRANIEIEL